MDLRGYTNVLVFLRYASSQQFRPFPAQPVLSITTSFHAESNPAFALPDAPSDIESTLFGLCRFSDSARALVDSPLPARSGEPMWTTSLRRISRTVIASAGLAFFAAGSSSAGAQATTAAAIAFGGIDKFLDRVETADLYYGWNLYQRGSTPGRYSVPTKNEFGLEFSFHVGSFGPERPGARAQAAKKVSEALAKAKSKADSVAVLARLYPDWKAKSVTIKKHYVLMANDTALAAVDSEFVASPNDMSLPQQFELDFAIGYGQLNGVKKDQPYEIRGYVRELPSIALYLTSWKVPHIGVYVGARTGVISLQDGQLFVPNGQTTKIFSLSATSFQMGGAFGVVIPVGKGDEAPNITLEFSPMWRHFNSLVSVPNDSTPTNMPHAMDLSGGSLTVGLMFPIPKPSIWHLLLSFSVGGYFPGLVTSLGGWILGPILIRRLLERRT